MEHTTKRNIRLKKTEDERKQAAKRKQATKGHMRKKETYEKKGDGDERKHMTKGKDD